MFKIQLENLLYAIKKPVYRWLFPLWVILFAGLNIYLNQLYVTGLNLFNYRLGIIVPYLIFTILNTILAGISINLIIIRIRKLGITSSSGGGFSILGTIGALITGACPGCLAGLLPAFIGLFGIPIGVTGLPLFGLILQISSFFLLLLGIFFLTRPFVCDVE